MSDEQRIRHRAHEIWEREGRPEGRHEDHWARARHEISKELAEPGSATSSLDDGRGPPQMPTSGIFGGSSGAEADAHLSGGVGTALSQGSGAAGGDSGPLGGAGGSAAHHPGIGASMTDSPPRLGPAPLPADDAGPGLADSGTPHGPSAADRGKAPRGGARAGKAARSATKGEAGAAGLSGDAASGRVSGRG
ncbi:MAG TPA: DUF2934 domain-containing protein [Falsiroseomonas sp.]|nr:DUF2934 domain-containing protein [Falsiroseomonas sp.]